MKRIFTIFATLGLVLGLAGCEKQPVTGYTDYCTVIIENTGKLYSFTYTGSDGDEHSDVYAGSYLVKKGTDITFSYQKYKSGEYSDAENSINVGNAEKLYINVTTTGAQIVEEFENHPTVQF